MRHFFFIVIILTINFKNANGLNIRQISYFPQGQYGSYGFIRAFDTNHNGLNELIFFTQNGGPTFRVEDYEYRPINRYVLADTLVPYSYPFWNVGYIDNDSLSDIIIQKGDSIHVYESPDFNHYPDSQVWGADINTVFIAPSYITDLDRDCRKEILTKDMQNNIIYIFENTTDNQYFLVYIDNFTNFIPAYTPTFAMDDFDRDSLEEFLTSNSDGHVIIWECVGDNLYEVVWIDTIWIAPGIHAVNAYDDVSANDMDQDGKPEFIIQSVYNAGGTWTALFSFFEAVGDNTYAEVYRDSVTGIATFPDYYSASYCGDIDGDGIDEAVMALANNFVIYKATGNNVWQKIFTAYPSGNGRANTSIYIYDMNQNGYKEIIESGAWSSVSSGTTIWEIEGVRLHQPNGGETLHPNQQYPITWEKFTPPGADSFSLFVSFDNGQTYQTIITSLTGSDTSYLWTVPDTVSDSCKVMIWAYGPPRPGEQEPRGVAWDFSDTVFIITDVRIQENRPAEGVHDLLEIFPIISNNGKFKIRFYAMHSGLNELVLYNAMGQVAMIVFRGEVEKGTYTVKLTARLPNGVYFLMLKQGEYQLTKKILLTR